MVTRKNVLNYRHIYFRGRLSLNYVAPTSLTEKVFKLVHETFRAGHLVVMTTTDRLAATYCCLVLW